MGNDPDDYQSEEEGMCENLIFVNLLKESRILFDKDCTPLAKNQKKSALEALTMSYNFQTNQQLNTKQVQTKFNNMKARIKEKSENRNHKRNKRLKKWEQAFSELWSGDNNFPMINSSFAMDTKPDMSFQMTSCKSDDNSSMLYTNNSPAAVHEPYVPYPAYPNRDEEHHHKEDDSWENMKTEDLQRMLLIAQIKTAQAQEKAAMAQEKAAVAQEELALKRLQHNQQ